MKKSTRESLIFYSLATISAVPVFLLALQQIELRGRLSGNEQQCVKQLNQLADHYEQELSNLAARLESLAGINTISDAASTAYFDRNSVEDRSATRETPTLAHFAESLEEIVTRKYRFLLDRLDLDTAQADELFLLLMQREQLAMMIRDADSYGDESGIIASDVESLKSELKEIDSLIETLLDPDNRTRYTLLKDSDNEQQHFNQYALGVNGLFSLDRAKQETVLFSRLRHKRHFEEALASSGLSQDYPLTRAQQDKLLKEIEMAVQRYKHAFLQEVHGSLDHDSYPMDQYTMLENYTNTEFQQFMERLRQKVRERGVIN